MPAGTTVQPAQPQLRTRTPTGLPSWPLILVEGPEKTGKSWLCALLTSSPRIGRALWLDWTEGEGDQYGSIPGVQYELIDHDGTFEDIGRQIFAARCEAQSALDRGEKPLLLVIDSMTAEWDALKAWADQRARNTESAKRKLARNPGADIPVPMNVWSDVSERHYRIMRLLMTFPGIVVMTARGKEIAAVGDDGKPTGERDYKVEGHKNLAFDATAWVRLSRNQPPQVIGARSVTGGGRPGQDEARPVPDLSLDWLTFQQLLGGLDKAGQVRNLPEAPPVNAAPPAAASSQGQHAIAAEPAPAVPEQPAEAERDWDAERRRLTGNVEGLLALYRRAQSSGADPAVLARIKADGESARAQTQPAEGPSGKNSSRVTDGGGDGADVADPVSDQIMCDGAQPEGMTRTGSDGNPLGLCSRCDQWIALTDSGALQAHPTTITEEASAPDNS